MKHITKKMFAALLAAAVLSGGAAFAQDSGTDIEESYKNMVSIMPVENEGMLALQYDPFGQHEVSLVGTFCVAGPYSMEVSVGLLDFTGDFAVSLGLDVVNFHWAFTLTENINWGFGAGVPFYFHLVDFDLGINPHGQLDVTFFTNSAVSLTVYARPGARVSFNGDGARFTCPFGVGISVPGDILASIVSSMGSIVSAAQ